MLSTGKGLTLALILSASFAGSAAAQTSCEIDEGKPSQVGRAFISVTTAASAQQAGDWAGSARALKSAVQSLTDPKLNGNELGRTFVLGKAMSLWLNHPDLPAQPTKEALGFTQGAAEPVNLVVTVDSLFSVVEKAQPACVATLSEWRRQRAWVQMVNGAIDHLNAGRLDSAEMIARQSLILSPNPYGYMVLGNVAQSRHNTAQALELYRQSVEAATDSIYRDVREQTLITMGNLAADAAEDTSATVRMELARQAAASYRQLMSESPTSAVAPQARAGLSRALLLQGDTASFRASLKEHLENPTKYAYQDVLASAVAAARAGQWTEAVQLFEGALQSNPWNRDALYNAALGYHELNQFEKMVPHVRKLVQVDPSNGENWRLFAYAYNGMSKASKVPAQQRALNDSVVKYFEMAEKMPHQVQFTEFGNSPAKTTLSGVVENRGTEPKSYTLRFEFIDKSGAVVATREATVPTVAPQATGRFTVTVEDAPTAVAFRYAPLG